MEPILNRTSLKLESNVQSIQIVDRGVSMHNLSLRVEVPDSLLGHNLRIRFDNLNKTHYWGINSLTLDERYIVINPSDDSNLGLVEWPAYEISFELLDGVSGEIVVSAYELE